MRLVVVIVLLLIATASVGSSSSSHSPRSALFIASSFDVATTTHPASRGSSTVCWWKRPLPQERRLLGSGGRSSYRSRRSDLLLLRNNMMSSSKSSTTGSAGAEETDSSSNSLVLSLVDHLLLADTHSSNTSHNKAAKVEEEDGVGAGDASPSANTNTNKVTENNKNKNNKIRLVLASQSPRRREILDMMGLHNRYVVIPSPLDESKLQQQLQHLRDNPSEYTRILAEEKAWALVAAASNDDGLLLDESIRNEGDEGCRSTTTLVLGSDTIVAYDGHILEKPVDENDAKRMLRQLQGQRHCVHTGVALVQIDNNEQQQPFNDNAGTANNNKKKITSFTDTAHVTFAELSEKDIDAYVATNEPMDKAGSYGIQGIGGQLVTSIEGDFFTVMGLPMHRTSQALAQAIRDILAGWSG